ncbi:hypothetical protein MMC30_004588 [Trapelia coarctata]|nr:hypothetical protein [Trapelia coarctata]
MDIDVAQGKNIADASKEAGVQHLIWSSLPSAAKITNGKLKKAKAFDSKAAVEEYIRELNLPASFYMSGIFMSNLKLATRKTPDGYVIAWPLMPMTRIPLIDAASDTGKWVTAILSKPSEPFGKRIPAANGWITPEEIVSTISEVAGIEVTFKPISDEVFKSFFPFPPPIADMRSEALIVLREYNYFGPNAHAEIPESMKILNKKPTSFREFVEKRLPWVT